MHELCEFLHNELKQLERKVSNGQKLTANEIEYGDKIAHFEKCLYMIEDMDEGGYSGNDGMSYARGSRGGRRGGRRGGANQYGSYENRSYDMGYSRGNESMIEELRDLMEDAPDEHTRREFHTFIKKLEKM